MTRLELAKLLAETVDDATVYPDGEMTDRDCLISQAYLKGIMDFYNAVEMFLKEKEKETEKAYAEWLEK